MSSYNKVTLLGNLTQKPELRNTAKGMAVTELRMAMNRSWTNDRGEKQEDVTYVDVTVWGRPAENAVQFLEKGRSVLVEGRLQTDFWQDKQTGQNRTKLKVVADSLLFLGANQQAGQGGQGRPSSSSNMSSTGNGQASRSQDRPPQDRGSHSSHPTYADGTPV